MNKIIIIGIICAGCSGEEFTSDGDAGNFGDAGDSGWAGGSGDSGSSGVSGASGDSGAAGVSGAAGTPACRTSCYQAIKEDFGEELTSKMNYCLTDKTSLDTLYAEYDKLNLCENAVCDLCSDVETPDDGVFSLDDRICGAALVGLDVGACNRYDQPLDPGYKTLSFADYLFGPGNIVFYPGAQGSASSGIFGSKSSVQYKSCTYVSTIVLTNIFYPPNWMTPGQESNWVWVNEDY